MILVYFCDQIYKESDMKLKFSTLFASALLLMASCGSGDNKELTFEPITVDKTVKLSNDETSPDCSVSLKMMSANEENNEAAKQINTTVTERLLNARDVTMKTAAEEFAENYTKTYKSNLLPLYNQDRADTTKHAWYDYHYIILSETQPGSKGTVVYLATVDYYEGGTHGQNQLITMNFDTTTGKLLTLSDIFINGYEQELTATLLKALKEKTGVKTMGELKEKGYLTAMDMFPAENFILGEETITFVYNPYEIAPYTMGSTELTISFSDVERILKNSFDY